jgi:hypothetical protein
LFAAKASVEVFPPTGFVDFDPPEFSATSLAESALANVETRQTGPSEFVFTPEVCLGPVGLPHGPPCLI